MSFLLSDSLKVMVVAPGSTMSTFDMYKYYTAAFKKILGTENAVGFPYHSWIQYHSEAVEQMPNKPESEDDKANLAITYASRELIADIAIELPDVILFIDGTKVPPQIYSHLKHLRRRLGLNFFIGVYLTDEPYISDLTTGLINSVDFVFCNDKSVVESSGRKNMWYLPHSYAEDVHFPGEEPEEYQSDVFFCGTVYPERAQLFEGVDWTGINAAICGYWGITGIPEKLKDVAIDAIIPNVELANYYRGSKVGINVHRTMAVDFSKRIDAAAAYSVGPRVIESAACGLAQVSDYRPELTDIFGDSILTFTTAQELEWKVRHLLSDEMYRYNLAKAARQAVAGMSYTNRATVLAEKFLEAKQKAIHGGVYNA